MYLENGHLFPLSPHQLRAYVELDEVLPLSIRCTLHLHTFVPLIFQRRNQYYCIR